MCYHKRSEAIDELTLVYGLALGCLIEAEDELRGGSVKVEYRERRSAKG